MGSPLEELRARRSSRPGHSSSYRPRPPAEIPATRRPPTQQRSGSVRRHWASPRWRGRARRPSPSLPQATFLQLRAELSKPGEPLLTALRPPRGGPQPGSCRRRQAFWSWSPGSVPVTSQNSPQLERAQDSGESLTQTLGKRVSTPGPGNHQHTLPHTLLHSSQCTDWRRGHSWPTPTRRVAVQPSAAGQAKLAGDSLAPSWSLSLNQRERSTVTDYRASA